MAVPRESASKEAARYRELAEEAEALARSSAFPEMRETYLKYARCWRALAEETENGGMFRV